MSEESILLASFDPMVAKWLLSLSDSSLGFVTDNPFAFKDVTVVFPDFLEVSSLIVCQVLLVTLVLVKGILIIGLFG